MEKLLQRLVAETHSRQPAPVSPPAPVGLGNLFRSYLSGQQTSGSQTRQRPIRRDWNGVVCFSCGKSGHGATRCPALDESFPFMLPGWRSESTPGGFHPVWWRSVVERKTATDPTFRHCRETPSDGTCWDIIPGRSCGPCWPGMTRILQVALLASMGHCPHLTLTLLAPTVRMLQGALLAQMGRCPRFSLTLLAWMARMLQVALLARMEHCPHLTLTLLAPTARMLQGALLAQMGHCPHLSLTLLAQMARMLQVALLAHMGPCPHLTLTLLALTARMCRGPVGPDGTLSPFISDPAGPDGPCVADGPVGPYGTLSPLNYYPAGPDGHMLQEALLARLGHCPRLTPIM